MFADGWLRKRAWLLPLPLVLLAAYLNGSAVTQLLGITLAPDAAQLARAYSAGAGNGLPSSASSARTVSADPILKRNPFDHVTGSLVATPSTDVAAASSSSESAPDTSDPFSAPACEGFNVNAVAASSDADWSFAAITGPDKKSHLLRRGSELGGKKLHFVGWDRVWMTEGASLCQAKVFDDKKPPATPPAASAAPSASSSASAAPSRGGAKPLDPDLRKGIQAVSATEFNIDRGVVDKILENQAELMRQARIVPVTENGRTTGIRLNGLRPDTLLTVLGMQNGDQLQTINGFELASPEKALEAYARLRTAEKLTIRINRNGKTMNLDYNIK